MAKQGAASATDHNLKFCNSVGGAGVRKLPVRKKFGAS
jgi:hypothetical protein